ncbi:hypothetical protein THAOC_33525 [Thalassiosira oceanica]|uniref:Uncharacterized protein n=1 Tax=Thalassiosira oceanica TaxID=159749 RepID=K0R420_THAOC|nr:hypothetical protein THAOC_33525 [Thalassiosira oceanica]|eukprot:EJK47738.1 hypothetical protein THAOC_33525 [Thalassiosira oceanica]
MNVSTQRTRSRGGCSDQDPLSLPPTPTGPKGASVRVVLFVCSWKVISSRPLRKKRPRYVPTKSRITKNDQNHGAPRATQIAPPQPGASTNRMAVGAVGNIESRRMDDSIQAAALSDMQIRSQTGGQPTEVPLRSDVINGSNKTLA